MTVSEQIIQVIDKLCEKFGMAIDWTGENVVPYIETLGQKLVTYEIATSVAWMAICFVAIICLIAVTKKFIVVSKRDDFGEEACFFFTFALIFVSIFIYTIGVATIVNQIMDIIKCVTFPEMYVFEYVQSLINSQ